MLLYHPFMHQHPFHLSFKTAQQALQQQPQPFLELFRHGSLQVELYQPDQVDLQQPHSRDEVYLIAAGSGTFQLEDQSFPFQQGDFLFVPAGKEHRFVAFTPNFITWVLFYGPEGGEEA